MELLTISESLAQQLDRLEFSAPVAHVYNPLRYAWEPHRQYLTRYGARGKKTVFLGMNPGPWGMAQTGIPFGEVAVVRDWLKITDPVRRPDGEHPKKPVLGLDCRRSEVSGKRLWGMIRDVFETPNCFFEQHFVLNYCPLLFLDAGGANLTPDKLLAAERTALLEVCNGALRHIVEYLDPDCLVGVGNFAAAQAESVLQGLPVKVARILHPSPASPAANRGWKEIALRQMAESGVCFQP